MHKIRLLNILLVVIAATFIACSSDYEHNVPEVEIPEVQTEAISFTEDELLVLKQMRNPGNRICIAEATDITLDAFDFFNNEISTRSGQVRAIASITALQGEPATGMSTRSVNGNEVEVKIPDTVAFVFNFTDDAGFAIVAADTRIESQVLAFTDNGNFENAVNIPGVEIFLEGLDAYIKYSIIKAEHRRDSLWESILAKSQEMMEELQTITTRWGGGCLWCGSTPPPIGIPLLMLPYSIHYGPWFTTEIVSPLLIVEWGQGFPFNHQIPILCPNRPDGRAPAGCVATATAMLMAFWQHPSQIDSDRFALNWNLLNRFTARPNAYANVMGKDSVPQFGKPHNPNQQLYVNQISELMLRIGTNIGMNYTCTGSGAATRNAVNWLGSLGYTVPQVEWGYNPTSVRGSLNNRHPVLIEGWTAAGGHLWVIDGHLRQSRVETTEYRFGWFNGSQIVFQTGCNMCGVDPPMISIQTQTSPFYIHNNWGWDGRGNGFFIEGSFDVLQRRFESDGTIGSRPNLDPHNFNHGLSTFTNIRR
jgi:hypothetical protein